MTRLSASRLAALLTAALVATLLVAPVAPARAVDVASNFEVTHLVNALGGFFDTSKDDQGGPSGVPDAQPEPQDPSVSPLPRLGDLFGTGSSGQPDEPPAPQADPEKQYNTAYQMTEDDIFAMNNGDAAMLFTDGYLTFLRGRYCDQKVTNMEEGISSLDGMAQLLGLLKGSEFYSVYVDEMPSGYTCYVYQQRYGDVTIQNAVLKIFVDPEGYPVGLVSSFTPNIGFASDDEPAITPEEAQAIAQETFPDEELTFYPEYTRQTSMTLGGVAYHAWAVFSNFPSDFDAPDGRTYMEHLVAYDGGYLMYLAVSSPEELVLGDNAITELALSWFDGLEADTYTGTVTLHDGTTREITVPVARAADGTYYLADVDRHILLTDCYEFMYDGFQYLAYTSDDNTGWPEHYLITYDTYIKVYDFFTKMGLRSMDGFGAPILILTDYVDEYGYPIDNACYLGTVLGWQLIAASTLNDYGECVDVCGHEYTHGITSYALAGDLYTNESGALNEALSDIMGNLVELSMGATDDDQWLIAENCGIPVRNMGFPWEFEQPVVVGGMYYEEPTDNPTMYNDFGGVHTNSSLANYVAWQLCAQGMSYEDALWLWLDTIRLLTPYSGLRELHQALLFAAEMQGMDVMWLGRIEMACEQVGF